MRVATHRAAHQLLDDPVVFRDPLALTILGPEAANAVRADPGRSEQSAIAPFLRAFLAVRRRVAEDTLAELVGDGITQYVVLGAGLDTFAYRNPYPPSSLRIFEVDHPATQAWKRARLRSAGVALPENLDFVPVDFERQDLRTELMASGLRPDRATFFAWLGVTPYLTREAIDATLDVIGGFCDTGGGVVFDYMPPPESLSLPARLVFAMMAKRVSRIGEEFRSSMAPAELQEQMRQRGFDRVTDLDAGAINSTFFANRSDRLRVGEAGHILKATRSRRR